MAGILNLPAPGDFHALGMVRYSSPLAIWVIDADPNDSP